MTNSLGHLSKLCQVFHLMICVTLGVFFSLLIWHFLSKPCMVLRWQCSHEESLPYQESLCNLGSKERFFCLRQSLWLPAFPFLSIRSWGSQSTFCWGQRLRMTRWTSHKTATPYLQKRCQEIDYQTVKGILLFYSFGCYHFKRKTLKQKDREFRGTENSPCSQTLECWTLSEKKSVSSWLYFRAFDPFGSCCWCRIRDVNNGINIETEPPLSCAGRQRRLCWSTKGGSPEQEVTRLLGQRYSCFVLNLSNFLFPPIAICSSDSEKYVFAMHSWYFSSGL